MMAMSNEFFDLNMLPDQRPPDLCSKQGNSQQVGTLKSFQKGDNSEALRKESQYSMKPLKPISFGKTNHLPSKVFGSQNTNTASVAVAASTVVVPSSHYNSQKNLRNNYTGNTTSQINIGNNRYSSQNRNSEYEDEEEQQMLDEGEVEEEIADENCVTTQGGAGCINTSFSQTHRRGSQRYKDRVHNMRLQSQETYQREHMAATSSAVNYFTEMQAERKHEPQHRQGKDSTHMNDDDEFEIFERAHDMQQQTINQRTLYSNHHANLTMPDQPSNAKLRVNGVEPSTFYHYKQNNSKASKRWTAHQQPIESQNKTQHEHRVDQEWDKTPQEDLSACQFRDQSCGAHFQYRELVKRLSDMTSSSKGGQSSSHKRKSGKTRRVHHDGEGGGRIPLKEKTQEIANQPQQQHQQQQYQNSNIVKKKNMSILEPKLRPFSNSAKNPKKTEKVAAPNPTQMNHFVNTNQVAHQKLTKLLLTNQENNFIDKKLKDLQSELLMNGSSHKTNISKNISIQQNKSSNINLNGKTNDKTLSKLSSMQQQNCQINNMKIKSSSITQHSNSQTSQKQGTISILNNQAKIPSAQQKNGSQSSLQAVSSISNIQATAIVSSSISSANNNMQTTVHTSSTSALLLGNKCPSTNLLKTATTAFTTSTTTKSSTLLTQSNSNKQINTHNKETPECSTRQKVRLTGTAGSGTAFSSTSKRNHYTGGCMTTLSNNSQGGNAPPMTMHSSSKALQQIIYQQPDSERRSQNSSIDNKKQHSSRNHHASNSSQNNQQPQSAPRSNSSHKKVQVQKMMIKNPSFHQNLIQDNQAAASKKQMNDFYQTIFKKISNTNFTALANTNTQQQQQQQQMKYIQNSKINQEKSQCVGQSSKTTRVSGKVSRLSKGGGGSNTQSVNSNSKSKQRSSEKAPVQIQQSPKSDSHSKSRTRKSSNNAQRESIYGDAGSNKNSQKPSLSIMGQVNSQVQLQKMNQLLKKFQDTNQTASQQSQKMAAQQQQTQPSILMNHQMKKQPVLNSTRPLSGNNIPQNINHFLAEHHSFNRKNSIEKANQMQQQQQYIQQQLHSQQSMQHQTQNDQEDHIPMYTEKSQIFQTAANLVAGGPDNRQSLQVQHKTMEKKASNGMQPNTAYSGPMAGQINLKHSEKMSKYLQQKKEELAQATLKSAINTKKGFKLANIKIQKNGRLQQMTQETYERLHLPTEEDDLKGNDVETFQIGNLITNIKDEVYNIYHDTQPAPQQYIPIQAAQLTLQGGRLSVKVKAKNF